MNNITRKITAIALSAITLMTLAACTADPYEDGQPKATTDVSDSIDTIKKLNDADKIVVTKKFLSWNDQWTVDADGTEVAHIEGKTFPVWGDTYQLLTNDGNLMASESENIQWAGHGADLYDYNNAKVGHIKDELFSWGYKFHVLDAEGKELGLAQQKLLNLTLTLDINDSKGNTDYHARQGRVLLE